MRVEVEGLLTSVGIKEKEGKKSTELLLAQKGEKEQVTVRLEGDQQKLYEGKLLTNHKFAGRLMTWASRNGVGSMVMAEQL
ncbi:hypothetical protein D3C74_212510 [compost metagenome]